VRPLQIYNRGERAAVRVADAVFAPLAWGRRPSESIATAPQRVLLLRLERIGDLLMVLDAIGLARGFWPGAEIDLAVGSWNRDLAALIPDLNRIDVIDAPWLSRESRGASWPELIRHARGWRARQYDLVINFEPDLRSNLLAWFSGAQRRVGYWTGGGQALLTDSIDYHPAEHVSDNARHLVAHAARRSTRDVDARMRPRLTPPPAAVAEARAVLGQAERPLIGIHASGGRPSKQWHLDRFASVARTLASSRDATIVLTGAAGDRPLVDEVKRHLSGARIIDACGPMSLPALAALLAELDVLITSDSGPMHLAAAVGTPLVALFGPASPARYGPLSADARVLRVDLPCSPCGQVRLPPVRCRGHVPDCMDGITVARVVEAALEQLDRVPHVESSAPRRATGAPRRSGAGQTGSPRATARGGPGDEVPRSGE
jgi:lipopolysaccharide heptosyltransferase II